MYRVDREILEEMSDEVECPLTKSLSPVEWNYKIHNKEMLAIMRALEEWRHFVEGVEHYCEIWTDHKNLQYFMMAKKLNQRQAR